MEISLVGCIRTPFGEVELAPQDRNLLQASSVEPLQLGLLRVHLWSLLERTGETWGPSSVVPPMLHLVGRAGETSSIAAESIPEELINSVTSLAGEWAVAHPGAFEWAAAVSLEFDKEGVYRELEGLREMLRCSARAIESITSEAPSEISALLREYSKKMRSLASNVPAIQKITKGISSPGEVPSLPAEMPLSASNAPAVKAKTICLIDATGRGEKLETPVSASLPIFQQTLSSNQLTLGQLLKKQRKKMGISQRELALKLGLKADHLAQLESDRGVRPSFQLLSRAASILGLDKHRLFRLTQTSQRPIPQAPPKTTVWTAFARDRALLDRNKITPQELKALSEVSLMGKVARSEDLLFILDAIRRSGDADD